MITIPETRRGRRSAEQQAAYEAELEAFCQAIKEIRSRLDFDVSSRGWCYILEEHGLTKGDFDKAEGLIRECRKKGLLPLDIVAEDGARATENQVGAPDNETPEEYAESLHQVYITDAYETALSEVRRYIPKVFWDNQDYYIEMLVEKVDLKNLFKSICREFYIPITNSRGWSDLNSRAAMMRRFEHWESQGKDCILLYCGDHDPGGLHISDSLRSNMREIEEAVGWSPGKLTIDRFGLNHDFITDNNLSWVENLETSSGQRLDSPRHKDHRKPYVQGYLRQYGARKVEANALVTRPEAGRELCRRAIERYINSDNVDEYRGYIRGEQEKVREQLDEIMYQTGD